MRTKAAYINDETCDPSASPNWLASIADIVLPGANKEKLKLFEFPIIIVTAIVSPIALPRASITPPTIPEIAAGNVTLMIAPQRVVPIP